jgi:hypothetical protein
MQRCVFEVSFIVHQLPQVVKLSLLLRDEPPDAPPDLQRYLAGQALDLIL